jgi:hypothetical protein
MGAVGGLVPRPPFFTFAHVGLVYSASGISTRNLGANPKPLEPLLGLVPRIDAFVKDMKF